MFANRMLHGMLTSGSGRSHVDRLLRRGCGGRVSVMTMTPVMTAPRMATSVWPVMFSGLASVSMVGSAVFLAR